MEWKRGPVPPDTWFWGAVVPAGEVMVGFYFASFRGDVVELIPSGRLVRADQVAWYTNGIKLPPAGQGPAT